MRPFRHRLPRRARRLLLFAAPALAVLLGAALFFTNPPPVELAREYPSSTVLRDAEGGILRVRLGEGDVDCRPTYKPGGNPWLEKAIIAAEDGDFLRHRGVNPGAVLRAIFQNVTSARRVSGASTITMQAVRLISPHPRSYWWKLREAVQALRLERCMSKDEILAQYLNRAPFGSNLVGVEAAAHGWFGKTASELGLAEAALLAGLPQAPSRYRPDRHLAAALRRREYVFDRMQALGMLTAGERAKASSPALAIPSSPRPFRDPWFCDWVLQARPGLRGDHRTTLQPGLQEMLRGICESGSRENGGATVAAVVLSVRDSSVLAMTSSGDYEDGAAGQIVAAAIPRPAGSTLKPFAFALAMDAGRITPATALPDVPRSFGNNVFHNFAGGYKGIVTAREALVLSLNLPALELAEEVGPERLVDLMRALGVSTAAAPSKDYGLGIVLGNLPVRLVELAGAYACLARLGEFLPLRPLGNGGPRAGDRRRRISAGAAWLVSDILADDDRLPSVIGHAAGAPLPRFAWKTGTSSGFRDAWTFAWNPEFVIGVWIGSKQGGPGREGRTGIDAAAPIAWRVARHLYPQGQSPWYERPGTVGVREVCALSGLPPGPYCGRRIEDFFLQGLSLCIPCPVHVRDASGKVAVRWPARIAEGLRLLGGRGAAPSAAAPACPRITSPADGTAYKFVEGLEGQAVAFEAEGVPDGASAYWFVNGRHAASTAPGEAFRWNLRKGAFSITVSLPNGAMDQISILVE